MTVVCHPYRIEKSEHDLLFRVKHGRRLGFTRFVVMVAGVATLAAVGVHALLARALADVVPALADPATTIPSLAWIVTLSAGLFFARRMDAAVAVVAPMPEQTVTIASDGVRVETPVSDTAWRWSGWTRFHDLPEALMLEEPSGAMLILPARAFPDAEARAVAREMVAAHLPLAERTGPKA